MNPLLSGLLGTLPQAIADYLTKRLETKAAEKQRELELRDAIHKRQVELVQAGLAADATWEIEQIRNSGWKDEYVLLVLSIPLVGCFIPGLDAFVLRGFEVLGMTPGWYQTLIVLVFGAIYGIRIWRRQQSDT